MKYLTINNGKGYFIVNSADTEEKEISEISKEDLMKLLDLCLSEDDFEMDEFDANTLHNRAHQVIYKNIYIKLMDVRNKRVSFSDEKSTMYKKAIEEYSSSDDDQISED